MRRASLLGHVIQLLEKFTANPAVPADAIIRSFFYERKYLGSKDRKFIADVYFDIIKNYRRMEFLARDAFGDVTITQPHIVAAYAVATLELTPEETREDLAEKMSLPIDALRLLTDRGRELSALSKLGPIERVATAYSFPDWFVERITKEYGPNDVERILTALNDEAPTVFRANTLVTPNREQLAEELLKEGCETAFSHIAQDALISAKRVNTLGMKSFQRGAFEVQDEASQLVAPFAGIMKTAIRVLDPCAGAGGKTLHLAALLKNRGEIYATDVEDRKLDELKKRIRRSTAQNVRIVRNADKARMLGANKKQWFDLVLLDVPCTGTGTLRRNPGIKWVLTEKSLHELTAKQQLILEENFDFVRPGGTLLYATCSLLKEEGEGQIDQFLANHADFELEQTMRTRPDTEGCDGFFAARLRRKLSDSIPA